MARRTRRYRIDAPAVLFIGTTFIIGLGAFFSQNNLLYIAFGLAIGTLLASGVFCGSSLLTIDARRIPPVGAVVGEAVTMTYELTSRSRRPPAIAVNVLENITRRPDGWEHALAITPAFSPLVRAHQRTRCSAIVVPECRGQWRLGTIEITTRFPFGVIRKSVLVKSPGAILALPRQIEPPTGLIDDAMTRSSHRAESKRFTNEGSEPEFYALREYLPGDSRRSIAWRASARRDKLVVKIQAGAARRAIRVAVLFAEQDPFDEENERAISLAAGIIADASRRGCAVGLCVPGLSAYTRAPIRAGGGIGPLLEDLARINIGDVDAALQQSWRPHFDDALIVVGATGALLADAPSDAVTLDASYARPAPDKFAEALA